MRDWESGESMGNLSADVRPAIYTLVRMMAILAGYPRESLIHVRSHTTTAVTSLRKRREKVFSLFCACGKSLCLLFHLWQISFERARLSPPIFRSVELSKVHTAAGIMWLSLRVSGSSGVIIEPQDLLGPPACWVRALPYFDDHISGDRSGVSSR